MIRVSHIVKAYKKQVVLKDCSLYASAGEMVAIVGKNGCGKTTLLKVLTGILKPDAGELEYYSHNPLKEKKVFEKLCGYVPQENPLIEELSVLDNLKFWGVTKTANYGYVLEVFQLQDILKKKVSVLSGGMKRRLSIVCAMAGYPPILVLDEPTTALDLYYKDNIRNLLQAYKQKSGIVIMATHDECEIELADRCYFMTDGVLQEVNNKEILLSKVRM
ncbi:MAG: ABC transporter ATP-binding protein [Lachnospiraceae bacterium]|nr:ABC transporter ATP-binding protein [Lachnospiraceae bacterium]